MLKLNKLEAEKLKELDHFKSRFFANISHEFRTPLTLIIGPLEDLLQGGDPKKLTALIPEMYRNSKRLMQLINQLLDLSKLDSGKYAIHTNRDDIIPFVRQLVDSFNSLAEKKKITLNTQVSPELSTLLEPGNEHFYFDADILEKILTNLLSNAFKFTPEKGEIIVTLSIDLESGRFLKMEVKDNGIGISEENLSSIFNRFYQIEQNTIQSNIGSGIGLYLVKELVELHYGRITVESKSDKGSRFTCLFPLDHPIDSKTKESKPEGKQILQLDLSPETEMLPELIEKPIVGSHHILVVEDNPDVRKYIVEKLKGNYNVSEAENGLTGFEVACRDIPDLVISDVMMPEMDGFTFCQALKTDNRTSHIPVILLTARAEDADKITGLETGADDYLIKPFNTKELLVRIKNLIELRAKLRAKFSEKLIVKPSEITVTSRDSLFIQSVLSVIEQQLSNEQLSVEEIAVKVNMSASQLNRKLNAIINQSAGAFIRSIRMQRAMELLKKDHASISEVAYATGFAEPSYFTRVFKNYYGYPPSEVRNEPKQEK